jgi:5-methyltetrahydrofolate--homocysteine methyltransferase
MEKSMNRVDLSKRIKQGPLILDGAMGTQLIARGVEVGKCNDYLNIESPEVVCEIHQAYFKAGSEAVLTDTFGANKYALSRHGYSEMAEKINAAGAAIARRAAGEDKCVLGDIGPCGDFLHPLGPLKPDELKAAFAEQAKGLLAGPVDGFIVETMTALDEIEVAIDAVKSVSSLAVFASMSFDKAGDDFRTMMGVDVESAVSKMVSLGVDAVGFNCGGMSLDDYVVLAERIVSAVRASGEHLPVLAEPNAGQPELVQGKAVYKVSREDFAAAMEKIHLVGATILGGCCGTGPEDIEAVAKKLK